MKKIITLIIAGILLLSFSACSPTGKKPPAAHGIDVANKMTCEEIINYVYKSIGEIDFVKQVESNDNTLMTTKIPDGDTSYFGVKLDYIEACASEPDYQPPAYSFCVAKFSDQADFEKIEQLIFQNANPNKWICDYVNTVYVERIGNFIALIMADKDTADEVKAAFLSLGDE